MISEPGGDAKAGDVPLPDLLELASAIDPELAIVIKSPYRVRIVALAHQRLISPSEAGEELEITTKQAAGHFKALSDAGFLELVRTEKVRGARRHLYRATKRAYFSEIDWGKLGKKVQKNTGEAVLADLNNRVIEALDAETFQGRDDTVLFWLGLQLDEEGWAEFVKILSWAIKEVRELGVDVMNRRSGSGEPEKRFPVTVGIMGFESPQPEPGKEVRRKPPSA